MASCQQCDAQGWVCESHPTLPWGGVSIRFDACHCGSAGQPCKMCNPCSRTEPPRDPPGFAPMRSKMN